ncbi:MAG: dihydroorotate dehydrogenase [Planctomycetia bacterium]|nr:dihydroorotate dehydrogenase [Planctomycetia bacterium]
MPDWSYRTVLKPLLFLLPAQAARGFALGAMGTLARLPLGGRVIDFLGHMRPADALRRELLGTTLASPVGLGCGLDVHAVALRALARFGFGFLEVGPVTIEGESAQVARRNDLEAICYSPRQPSLSLLLARQRLRHVASLPTPVFVRLGSAAGATPEQATRDCMAMIEALAPHAAALVLTTSIVALEAAWSEDVWRSHLQEVAAAARKLPGSPALVVCLPPDTAAADADRLLAPAIELGISAVNISGGVSLDGGRVIGRPEAAPARELVRHLREKWGEKATDPPCPPFGRGGEADPPTTHFGKEGKCDPPNPPFGRGGQKELAIIASGVHDPSSALSLLQAGADLVQIDAGLVYSGPGLPKRVNEAILSREDVEHRSPSPRAAAPVSRPAQQSWFWALLMGIAMLVGGGIAVAIASTRVVLPYDEAFVGMSRDELSRINDRLLAFMSHDRVSLAGTMVAVGLLYAALAWFGMRRGQHWARVSVLVSAFSGFASFFLFLGFGYFDPFHAFVTAVLFQFLLLALHSPDPAPAQCGPPDLVEDRPWRLAQWGQLLFVIQGSALFAAGLVISWVGITSVFVPEDLEFMQTTAEALTKANPRLVPLVAHDRASFGGMLTSCGLAVLLPSLWGFGRGRRWLWWALVIGGTAGYAAAIGVHLAVGYTDAMHLAPAFGGAAVLYAGAALSWPYLCGRGRE